MIGRFILSDDVSYWSSTIYGYEDDWKQNFLTGRQYDGYGYGNGEYFVRHLKDL
jgi:hypothetical protein